MNLRTQYAKTTKEPGHRLDAIHVLEAVIAARQMAFAGRELAGYTVVPETSCTRGLLEIHHRTKKSEGRPFWQPDSNFYCNAVSHFSIQRHLWASGASLYLYAPPFSFSLPSPRSPSHHLPLPGPPVIPIPRYSCSTPPRSFLPSILSYRARCQPLNSRRPSPSDS